RLRPRAPRDEGRREGRGRAPLRAREGGARGGARRVPEEALVSRAMEAPRRVASYELQELLVEGAGASLHRARHAETGAEVTLHVIDAEHLSPKARARIVRDARLQGEVRHASVVPVLD